MIINPVVSGIQLPELVTPAGAGQILGGFQAIGADGEVITGSIPSQGAQAFTPGTAAQQISAGRYLSGAQTIAGDANLVPENIAEGVSIFGVTGTHSGGGQLYSVTSDGANIFFPQLAVAGQFVTTVSGTYNSEFTPIYDITMTYILGTAYSGKFDALPPQVQEIINQYSQTQNNAIDTPITRALPPTSTGYLYFIMPQQDVVIPP